MKAKRSSDLVDCPRQIQFCEKDRDASLDQRWAAGPARALRVTSAASADAIQTCGVWSTSTTWWLWPRRRDRDRDGDGGRQAVPYLVGAVVIVGLLALLNLLLTFGVIRRLREHTDQLSVRAAGPPDLMVAVGESPASFSTRTTDGAHISTESMTGGERLVGFFSPSCQPCKEIAPAFAARAARGGRDQALAVVVGGPNEVGDLVARFETVAQVVVESDADAGTVSRAFKVNGFPAICLLGTDGAVAASGRDIVEPVAASSS